MFHRRRKNKPQKPKFTTYTVVTNIPEDGVNQLISLVAKEYLASKSLVDFKPAEDESNDAPMFYLEELDAILATRFELEEESNDPQILIASSAIQYYCHGISRRINETIDYVLRWYKTAEVFGNIMVNVPDVVNDLKNGVPYNESSLILTGFKDVVFLGENKTTSMLFASFLVEGYLLSIPFTFDFSELHVREKDQLPKPTHDAPKRVQ